jgi:diphthine synthase
MLALIGIGLDTGDISVRALEFLKTAKVVCADRYTSVIGQQSLDFIKKESGKEIKTITRSDLEEKVGLTIRPAKDSDMAILVIGDPLVATTHHIILDEAIGQGISTKIFHAPSIFSAGIGESGLDMYKFGPATTVPFWSEHYKPTSFMDVLSKNLSNSEHTLMLLDIDQAKGAPMSIVQAAEIINKSNKKNTLRSETKVMVLADIGRDGQTIFYTKFSMLESLSVKLEGKTLSIIVPAELNFAEEAAVKKFETR